VCQSYNINLTCLICNYFAGKTITTSFEISSFYGQELARDFGEKSGIRSLRIFSKPSAINEFGMPLTTTIWVWLAMLFPSAWWVVENFLLDLNTNYFLYPLAVGGVGCNVDVFEKSDKAKTEVLHFVSSILTSYMVLLRMFDRLSVDRPWCNSLKEEALLWRSSKHLGSENLDQRCNVNLIMRRVTRLKSKFHHLTLWY